MALWDDIRAGAETSWTKVRETTGKVMDKVGAESEAALKKIKGRQQYSRDDFAKAFAAAGALMCAADGTVTDSEVERVRKRMALHPILGDVRESTREEYLNTAMDMVEEGMLFELFGQIEQLTAPIFDASGNVAANEEGLAEMEAKTGSIIAMVTAVKNDDADISAEEFEMLESIAYVLGRNPTTIGMREDLLENPPALINNLLG